VDVKELNIDRIHRAFSPAREIQDPELFVGRRLEIENGLSALMNRGGFLVIIGLRGVGKSSIAYQLKLIAEGNNRLIQILNLERFIPRKGFSFIVHYFRCDRFVNNTSVLLKRILFGDNDNPSLFSLTKTGDKYVVEFKKALEGEGGGSFGFAKVGLTGVREVTYAPYISDDLIQQFRQVLAVVRKDNQDRTGLLILIDEFDTIPDKSGFASIVKACSSDFVKFGVIGVATSVSELLQEHYSIGRQTDIIHVPLMPYDELIHILKRAEHLVGRTITFDDEASNEIALKSEGFPYFTHFLGKEAMLLAFHHRSPRVTLQDVQLVFQRLIEGRLTTIYEDLYHGIVKESPQRELLLKLFADEKSDEIFIRPIYATAKELGISNPSQVMREITNSKAGSQVLVKVRDQYYRFMDPVFKVYVRMRNWKL